MSLKHYLRSLWTAFSKIGINSERGGLAYNWLYARRNRGGVNSKTGFPVMLKIEFGPYGSEIKGYGKQVIAFYCPETLSSKENIGWWISTNSGNSWMIAPDEKVFLKVIDKVDVMI